MLLICSVMRIKRFIQHSPWSPTLGNFCRTAYTCQPIPKRMIWTMSRDFCNGISNIIYRANVWARELLRPFLRHQLTRPPCLRGQMQVSVTGCLHINIHFPLKENAPSTYIEIFLGYLIVHIARLWILTATLSLIYFLKKKKNPVLGSSAACSTF